MIDILLSIDNEQFYNDSYDQDSYCDLDYDFTVRGYTQGDFVKIKKVGSAEWCKNCNTRDYLTNIFFDCPISGIIELVELSESSSGFISDCEQHSIFEIYIDELLDDLYNYSKNEIIANFEKLDLRNFSDEIGRLQNKYNVILKDYIKDYLISNLPENPNY